MQGTDVVVVGGGPTGMLVAGDLARAGRSVTVLEQRERPSPLSRALVVHARTLEALDQRGLAGELVATGTTAPGLRLLGVVEVHLGGLPSPFPYLLVTPQTNVDRLLERYALDHGAAVVRGAAVTALTQDAEGVRVTARTATGEEVYRAAYVVGADGAHSSVRELVGQGFPGHAVLGSIMLADARLADPPREVLTIDASGDGFAFIAPYGDGRFRITTWDRSNQAGDHAPLAEEDIRRSLERASGTDFGLGDVTWLSRFHSDERQVASYRVGRVLLAGDAAHVHSPAGGQGMNTGIQDAANLAWKLAEVLDCPSAGADAVLDTYHSERHPVGRMALRTSGVMIRLVTVRSRPLCRLRTAALTALLRRPSMADHAARSISGVGIEYARSPGEHRLVGRRAGDLPLRGDDDPGRRRLFAALRAGGFVLVLAASTGEEPAAAVRARADGRPVRVVQRTDRGPGLLVRPDGHVAWAGTTAAGGGGGWTDALDRWVLRSRTAATAMA